MSHPSEPSACELCTQPGGTLLWEDPSCRIVLIAGPEGEAFPGFCRVIWHRHIAEMSDLAPADQRHLLHCVLAAEVAVRSVMQPDKINVASLGNVTPHLHWHVIPRWHDDSHFPSPVWATARRPMPARRPPDIATLRTALTAALAETSGGA